MGQHNKQATNKATLHDDEARVSTSPLLDLPGELRNKIYEACLVHHDPVTVTEDLKPPPLVSTSRLIRQETLPIYYLRNEFNMPIYNCDSALHQAWMINIVRPLATKHKIDVEYLARYRQSFTTIDNIIHWHKLLEWCQAVHSLRLPGRELDVNCTNRKWQVIEAALNISHEGRNLSWEEVCRQLQGVGLLSRSVVGVITDF